MTKKTMSAEDLKLSNSQLMSMYHLSKAQVKSVRAYASQHPEATEYPVCDEDVFRAPSEPDMSSGDNQMSGRRVAPSGYHPVLPSLPALPGIITYTDEWGRTVSTCYNPNAWWVGAYSAMGFCSQGVNLAVSVVDLLDAIQRLNGNNNCQ